jgi:hypothetical protein
VPALDLCLWLVGFPAMKRVSCVTTHVESTVEDAATLMAESADGIALTLEVSNRLFAGEDRYYARVMGTEGSGSLPPLEVFKQLGGRPIEVTPRQPRPQGGENPYTNAYRRLLDDFVQSVAGRSDAELPLEQVALMGFIEAAYRSAEPAGRSSYNGGGARMAALRSLLWPRPGERLVPTVSAILLALSFPPLHLVVPPFIGLVPFALWIHALAPDAEGRRAAVRGSMLFGAIYFGIVFYWILVALIWFTWLAILAFLAALVGLIGIATLFGWTLHRSVHGVRAPLWLALPVAWTGAEWFRAHLPSTIAFPWLGLGTSLTGTRSSSASRSWSGPGASRSGSQR